MVNEWTREDLPSLTDVLGEFSPAEHAQGAIEYRGAVLDHLNKHHPKPEFEGYCTCDGYGTGGLVVDCGVALHRAQYLAARARRERDQAREERDEAQMSERESQELRARMKELLDGVSNAVNPPEPPLVRWGKHDLPEKVREVVRERDEWKARAEAGLLAPAPLREEWSTRFPNGHLCPGKDRDYGLWFKGDMPKGVNVRRYVTDWEPADE